MEVSEASFIDILNKNPKIKDNITSMCPAGYVFKDVVFGNTSTKSFYDYCMISDSDGLNGLLQFWSNLCNTCTKYQDVADTDDGQASLLNYFSYLLFFFRLWEAFATSIVDKDLLDIKMVAEGSLKLLSDKPVHVTLRRMSSHEIAPAAFFVLKYQKSADDPGQNIWVEVLSSGALETVFLGHFLDVDTKIIIEKEDSSGNTTMCKLKDITVEMLLDLIFKD